MPLRIRMRKSWKIVLDNKAKCGIIRFADAGIAHPVERHLAKVEVASSSLVARSIQKPLAFRKRLFHIRGYDGIGRHAGFRFLCFTRVGSNPTTRTTSKQGRKVMWRHKHRHINRRPCFSLSVANPLRWALRRYWFGYRFPWCIKGFERERE